MINEQVLSEKLKYLIMSEMSKKFEIFEFHVEFMYTDGMRDRLEEYDIDIKRLPEDVHELRVGQ